MFLWTFFVAAFAGCLNEQNDLNFQSLFVSPNGTGLQFSNQEQSTHLLSFSIASITEVTPNEEPIHGHHVCYVCTEENATYYQNFSSCVDSSVTVNKEKTALAVYVSNWQWCDECLIEETNETVKGNYLDVVFLVKTLQGFTGKKYGPGGPNGKAPARDLAFGNFKLKFAQEYASNGIGNQVMASGYPHFSRNGNITYVTVRFQRQENSGNYVYQPMITSAPKAPHESGDHHSQGKTTTIVIAGLASMAGLIGLLYYWKNKMQEEKYVVAPIAPQPETNGHYASLEGSGLSLEQEELEQVGQAGEDEEAPDAEDPYANPDPDYVSEIKPVRLVTM